MKNSNDGSPSHQARTHSLVASCLQPPASAPACQHYCRNNIIFQFLGLESTLWNFGDSTGFSEVWWVKWNKKYCSSASFLVSTKISAWAWNAIRFQFSESRLSFSRSTIHIPYIRLDLSYLIKIENRNVWELSLHKLNGFYTSLQCALNPQTNQVEQTREID